jgi:hypothetical protein
MIYEKDIINNLLSTLLELDTKYVNFWQSLKRSEFKNKINR